MEPLFFYCKLLNIRFLNANASKSKFEQYLTSLLSTIRIIKVLQDLVPMMIGKLY